MALPWSPRWAAHIGRRPCVALSGKHLWIYCPGRPEVRRDVWANILTSAAGIKGGPQLGKAEVLRGLKNSMH